jgi:hypothetical protein
MGVSDYNSDFGCTPAQYHGQISRLWHALGPIKNQTSEDVFTLVVRALEEAQQRPSRREIAAMAMQGILTNCDLGDSTPSSIAGWAVDQADALIERLSADPVAEGLNLLPMYSRELDEGLTDGE